ncbi:MAG: isochorismatase family protein, partial [Candidatus Hodarchaeota archaeon]
MDLIEPVSRSSNLISVKDCFVLIIDVQDFFMKGLSETEQISYIAKYKHLIKLCQVLKIPLIVTAEDIKKNGSVNEDILGLLNETSVYDKFIYSCWGQKNIRKAIEKTQKKVAILCGLETDVCVTQTAIDLLDNNYRVLILLDLTYSRNPVEHKIGLKRMEFHGAMFGLLKSWQEEITAGVRTSINRIIKENDLSDI